MQRSSNVSVCGSFSNEKDKIKQKTLQYEWNDTHTEKDDKDVLVKVDEADCQSQSTSLDYLILKTAQQTPIDRSILQMMKLRLRG